jgi:hypothetical protein
MEPSAARVAASKPRKAREVRAGELFTEYLENEVAADEQYAGRVLRITGTVAEIGKDLLGTPYVLLLFRKDSPTGVQCLFDDAKGVSSLSKGRRVTIEGECSGKAINVIIRGCRLVK